MPPGAKNRSGKREHTFLCPICLTVADPSKEEVVVTVRNREYSRFKGSHWRCLSAVTELRRR